MLQLRCGRLQGTTMSALPPKADIAQHDRDVRFVPKADIALRFIAGNCFFRCGQCGRPSRAVHSTAIRCDLIDGYVSAEGSARDYGIADAQMLRNAAAREQEN
jgi:hypothetical protein